MRLPVHLSNLMLLALLGKMALVPPPPEPYPVALLECTVDPGYLSEEEISLGANSGFSILPVVNEWDKEADGIEISHTINSGDLIYGYIGKDQTTVFYGDNRFYAVVDDLCLEDMTALIPILEEFYPLWQDSIHYWGETTIFLSKFELQEFEQYLLELDKSWKECNIYKYQYSEKWIVAVDVIRDYCFEQPKFYDKAANINPMKFIGFIIQQPIKEAFSFVLPYLVNSILIALGLFVVFKIDRIKQVAISILILNLVASPVCLYMVFIGGWSLVFTFIKVNFYFFWSVFVVILLLHISSLDKASQGSSASTS